MDKLISFNNEELQVARRLEDYFSSSDMTFREKVFHALLIARYELEGHHFSNELERQKIMDFARVLDCLLQKTI
jgi:hypothetical protein